MSPLGMPDQIYLMRDLAYALRGSKGGELFAAAGQGVGLIKEIKSAKQVVDDFVEGAVDLLSKKTPSSVTAMQK